MIEQTALGTTDAPTTLAEMNAQGWRLISAVSGRTAVEPRSELGVTMFFERPLDRSGESASGSEVNGGGSHIAPGPLNRGTRRKR